MTDIVERLRDLRLVAFRHLREQAAQEIERLRRENAVQAENVQHWMDIALKRGHAIVAASATDQPTTHAQHVAARDQMITDMFNTTRERCGLTTDQPQALQSIPPHRHWWVAYAFQGRKVVEKICQDCGAIEPVTTTDKSGAGDA